jgi:processive 1,2-diacylglycerol beta-glucosyltransferase
MQVSNVIVTRGGTTTCAKALHFECPIIFNAFGGIMPQEQLTWKFFRNGAASEKIENVADFARLIDTWMTQPDAYQAARENFLKLRYVEDPTVLIDELVNLANEVARAKLKRRVFPPGNSEGGRTSRAPFAEPGTPASLSRPAP